jgi:hypothetical protein
MIKYSTNTYSQFGEDGIIAEVMRRLGITKGTCCEFGANDGKFCSNTLHLLKQGWTGYMIEGSIEYGGQLVENVKGLEVSALFSYVTPANVNWLVPANLDLLSIDCDGPDAGIWEAYNGRAKMVIIEINSSLPPAEDHFSIEKGANYSYMRRLGERKGYTLLCHTGNMVFVLNEYAELFEKDIDTTFNTSWQ